jgi:hypothetical protein
MLENLFINVFMGYLFLLFDGLFGFHLANKKGGSYYFFELRAFSPPWYFLKGPGVPKFRF